jgi:hypothetical protein
MTHDPLHDAFRALQTEGSPSCPPDEELVSLVLGEVAGDRRNSLADHVVSCRRCADGVRILYETHRETSGTRPATQARRWMSVAAVAAVLAIVGVLLARGPGQAPSAERGSVARDSAVVPNDGEVLLEPPSRLQWPSRSEAETYRAKLYRDSGELVWDSGTMSAASTELPADVRNRLETGAYYWVVETEGSRGPERSGPYSFRVGRTP